jgi:hypothetical protein
LKCSPHQYWGSWKKKNTCKNITPTFKNLNFFLKFPQILGLIQVIESSLRKHDYNNLALEVHANKNQNTPK